VFERLIADAQRSPDLACFRTKILEALAREIGASSGSLVDPPGRGWLEKGTKARIGVLAVAPCFRDLYVRHKARYERSGERLLRAMDSGAVIDSDVYTMAERQQLDLYTEILYPQGARSVLCAIVRHRGRPLSQLVLKRQGRGTPFRDRDAEALNRFLPIVALADAGFQYSAPGAFVTEAGGAARIATRPLGTREAEVAALVCKGMRNREIAVLIGTSCETVKKQVRNVFDKVGVSNRAELAGLVGGLSTP
jgi:DNA-binding NarL/FixJ family response regulator